MHLRQDFTPALERVNIRAQAMVNMIEEFTAEDMFEWLSNGDDIVIVDVRSEELYDLFQVEGPEPIPQFNISSIDFLELAEADHFYTGVRNEAAESISEWMQSRLGRGP